MDSKMHTISMSSQKRKTQNLPVARPQLQSPVRVSRRYGLVFDFLLKISCYNINISLKPRKNRILSIKNNNNNNNDEPVVDVLVLLGLLRARFAADRSTHVQKTEKLSTR